MNEVITSTKNETIKLAKSLRSKKGRVAEQSFLVDGVLCVDELLSHMPHLATHFFVLDGAQSDTISKAIASGQPIYRVAPHVLSAVSDSKSPQDIVAVALFPGVSPPDNGFILALDDVQDPQNVGTMIRTADAAGAAGVALSENCADHLSPKAVRASMGSVFHLPVFRVGLPEYLRSLVGCGYKLAVAHVSGSAEYTYDWKKTCLVIGNESRGVSQNIQTLSTDLVSVPMFGKAESLNAAVAAGILIYKIRT